MIPRHYPDSASLCRAVLEHAGDTCLLSFSAGKDALASWLQLREQGFTRIVPFYLYLIPGLEFIEHGLRYDEEAFQTPIMRMPHPSLSRMLRNLVFQSPERAAYLETLNFPVLSYEDIENEVRKRAGEPDAWVAIGTRTADSPIRLANVKRYGSLNPARKSFFPVFDWKIADVRAAILKSGLSLTVDYRMYGRSFDGIDRRFLAPIKEHFPRDYERILRWFPMAHLELARRSLGDTHAPA